MSFSFLFLPVPEDFEYYRAFAEAETVLRELDRDNHYHSRAEMVLREADPQEPCCSQSV